MLTREEIMHQLKDLLMMADETRWGNVGSCTEETRLVEDLGFTSIDMLFIVIAAEEQFGVRFENVTMSSFKKLGNVIDYLQEAMKK